MKSPTLHRSTRTALVGVAVGVLGLCLAGCSTMFSSSVPAPKTGDVPKGPPANAQALPVAPAPQPVAVVNGGVTPLDQALSLLTAVDPSKDVRADGRYSIVDPAGDRSSGNVSTSRVYVPGSYRVIYFPSESFGDHVDEDFRELVRVSDEKMRPDVFSPLSRSGGILDVSTDGFGNSVKAQEFASPDRQVADAAARLAAPLASGANVEETAGLELASTWVPVLVRVNGSSTLVKGKARKLGIAGVDEVSLAAAKDALDRRAGEQLVYFSEFGWGAFVADAKQPMSPVGSQEVQP